MLSFALTFALVSAALGTVAAASVYDHYDYWYWQPIQGILEVSESGSFRYAYNDLWWGARVGYFFADPSSRNGYEAENWFYDYCDSYGGCAYSRSAWGYASNLPGPLDLDNNYSNPSGEVNLEVDAFGASSIQANTWYYADFYLNPNSTWSRVKVRGVRTAQSTSCVRWFCAFEQDGRIILGYPGYVAPSGPYAWTND
jgi:hypothetical protein